MDTIVLQAIYIVKRGYFVNKIGIKKCQKQDFRIFIFQDFGIKLV